MAERLGDRWGIVAVGDGRAVKLTPATRLYGLGAVLFVALTFCSCSFDDRGGPAFMVALSLACIAYLFSIRQFSTTAELPLRVVVVGLVLSAVWQVEFLRLPPGPDDDIHRYVWDGHLQRLGYNPYVVVPSDPAVAKLHTPETRNLNNPDLPSPYPPGAQIFFRAVTAAYESVFAFKVAFVICEFGIAVVLLDLLRVSGRPAHWVLAYAWHPLLAVEASGSGHVDIVGALLLVISVAALARRWRAIAAVAFGLAIAVKFLPIVLLPLYWKRVRVRDATLAAAIVAVLYVPFFDHGSIPLGSLGTYVLGFRFNGPVFAALVRVVSPQLIAGLAVLVGWLTAAWLRRSSSVWSPDVFAWPMAASLLFAPVVFPWYLLWLLPYLTSASTLLIVVWSVAIIPTYIQWHLRALGHRWGALPSWVMLLEYGLVAITTAIVLFRRTSRAAAAAAND